jgi:hypothetical protein
VKKNKITVETQSENEKIQKINVHVTSQFYLILLHKYIKCNVKWNGEKIEIDEIKFRRIFEFQWNS